jgi:cell division protein FtsW (lipid II flippase)
VNLFFPVYDSPKNIIERRLLILAALFLFLFCLIVSLSPAVRLHNWVSDYRWMHWSGYLIWLTGFSLLYRRLNRRLPEHDAYLLPLFAILIGWGVLTIFRLDETLGLRQSVWLFFGFILFEVGLRYQKLLTMLRRYKYIWLTSGLLITALTFIFGQFPGGVGPRLWLGCCGIYFQPSEPLKLLLIIYLAAYMADRLPVSFNLGQLLSPTLILTGAAALILIAQRDLGTASLVIIIYTLIVFSASGKKRILISSGLSLLAAGVAGTLFFDVIRLRVEAWFNPWVDPSGRSFQIVQSLIAVAAGRLIGTGPGLGSPGFVPVAQSDFIAIAIAEETGLLGIIALLLLIGFLSLRGLNIALHAQNNFQRYLASGLSIYFAAQAILILGGNLRLIPLTGVTLPFVSYGGSSLLTSIISIILLFSIQSQDERTPLPVLNARPMLVTSALLLACLSVLALLAGWWGIVRSEALLSRPDNLRWIVNNRFVERGSLLDRRSTPLMITQGEPGNYSRVALYPSLANTTGYTNYRFGRAGLEATLDAYLSGRQGSPALDIWLADLIFAQSPPGLDIRLTLDLEIQKKVDQLLENHTGALVLMNAETGEILAMASHPTFDPNLIEEQWEELNADPRAPLLNRVTQGSYSPGSTLAPFLYARIASQIDLPALPSELTIQLEGQTLTCSLPPDSPLSWETAISAGCPAPIAELSSLIAANQIRDLYRNLGFYTPPNINLLVAHPSIDAPVTDVRLASLGRSDLTVSPLQMVLAASALSNGGILPSPRLVISVETPHQGWVILPTDPATTALAGQNLENVITRLASSDLPAWQTVGLAQSGSQQITWYIGGSLPGWGGTPLAIALVLEESNPLLAQSIGQAALNAAMQPNTPLGLSR